MLRGCHNDRGWLAQCMKMTLETLDLHRRQVIKVCICPLYHRYETECRLSSRLLLRNIVEPSLANADALCNTMRV